MILKIITWLLTKKEYKLSKKQKVLFNKNTSNKEIKLYRALLDKIDDYNSKTKDIIILRHYRYTVFSGSKRIKVDKENNNGE